VVSVLFADLVGFTPFAEERDPEEVRETLTTYFEIARGVIEQYGGQVEKFIGDAVVAVWGAPVAREDDAERAVRAALDLVADVRKLGPTIQARAAVLTGEAAVTIGATGQGMVAGDLVNTAARLQAIAEAGTVLVGDATHLAAEAAIAFEPVGEQSLKGKALPVNAWRATRVVAERGGRNRSDSLESPFVGRDQELQLLKDLFRATSSEHRLRLVSVIGPAGIGKSRLAWEFLKYIDGVVEDVWWHEGRSPAYGEGLTVWALGEMIRGRARLLESDDERTTRVRIAEMLAEHVLDADERRWIEPALLQLLGFGTGVPSEQLFAAWRTFFERLALTGPVAMVFADLHWADAGTLDFIDHMLDWSRGVPIFILTLARPELLERRPNWGAARRNFLSISLEPLPEAAMRELIAGLVPGLPEAAVRTIVTRADGIPLYAVETVRKLVADGRLVVEGDRYVPVGDVTTIAVPETLTALIRARLDALEPAEQSLLQDASVLGQTFTVAALSAMTGMQSASLEGHLRNLVRRELLTVDADPRSPELGQYGFVQALSREVAYNTLARPERKARHLAAARYFESLGTEELAGALAGHYLAAYENAGQGAEAEALAAQSRIALIAAADRAAALGAHEQSASFLVQALTVASADDDRAPLLERAGRALGSTGRYDEAAQSLRQAVDLYRSTGKRADAARATARLAQVLLQAFHLDVALPLLAAAVEEYADLGLDPGLIALRNQNARAHYLSNDNRAAIVLTESVLEGAEALDLPEIIADALVTRASALSNAGRTHEAVALLGAASELAEANGLWEVRLRAQNNTIAHLAARDPRAAMEIGRRALADARRLGLRTWVFALQGNLIETAQYTGEWDWALAELEQGFASDMEPEDRVYLQQVAVQFGAARGSDVTKALAEIDQFAALGHSTFAQSVSAGAHGAAALASGDLAQARAETERQNEGSDLNRPAGLLFIARIDLWQRDVAAARATAAQYRALAVHGAALELRLRSVDAGIAALEGRTADALREYRAVLAGLREMGLPWDEALTAIDMATLLDPAEPEVVAAVEAAREILINLGATPYVARLEAAMQRGRKPGAERIPSGNATEPVPIRT
jgi:class 3 adenylate cyclase